MIYRASRFSWASAAGVVLVSVGLALGVVAYSGRAVESPEQVLRENARPHLYRCQDRDECRLCQREQEWLRKNPGRDVADILDAIEQGMDDRVTYPDPDADASGPGRSPSSR